MKKNWTMRVGVSLLALTLITSCFVGGTFAKYTTSDSGEDTARVAKFGVSVIGDGTTFAKEYDADDDNYTDGVTVSSNVSVVAPGTEGSMVGFTLSGTPEVAVKVTYEATEFELGDNWLVEKVTKGEDGAADTTENVYYCPLEIKVGATTYKGTDYQTVDAFENAVKDAINAHNKDKVYAPGTNLSTQTTDNLSVSWAWAFENNDDGFDTQLGNKAVTEGSAGTISLKVTATVTQID